MALDTKTPKGYRKAWNGAFIIESEGQEEDTYWIYLKPGFSNGSGEHAIAADTKCQARSRLSDVEICECAECLKRG